MWRLLNFTDLRAHMLFWRRELAQQADTGGYNPSGSDAGPGGGFPEGPPKLGLGRVPRHILDHLPLDDIGQG